MKRSTHKKILFIALAAAVTATAARAEETYTLYGKARMSVDSTDRDGGTADTGRRTNVSSNSSRLGVKGVEGLGNGLKAIFQIETLVFMDDGTGTTGTLFGTGRNTYVGIAGDFGTVFAGLYDTPYKEATRIDLFGDTMGDYNTVMGTVNSNGTSSQFDRREPNTINYFSPKFSGLQLKGQYRFDEVAGSDANRYSLSGAYEEGPWLVSLAYEKHQNETSSFAVSGNLPAIVGHVGDTHGTKLGLAYTFNQDKTKLALAYEKLGQNGAPSVFNRNAWYLALSHKMDSNTLRLAYARVGANDQTSDSGAKFLAVGVGHAFSKRTELFALYARTDNDSNGRYGLGTTGSTGAVAAGAVGATPSTFSIGINHDF